MAGGEVVGFDVVEVGVHGFVDLAEVVAETVEDEAPGRGLVGGGEGADGDGHVAAPGA